MINQLDHKLCNNCNKFLTIEHFQLDKYKKSGINLSCINCKIMKLIEKDPKVLQERQRSKKKYTQNKEKMEKQRKSPEGKFNQAVYRAKRKNQIWKLTKDQYIQLIIQGCHYCKKDLTTEFGCSLDRINNNLGYLLDNIVPCCGFCNSIKSNILTKEETEVAIKAIMKLRDKI